MQKKSTEEDELINRLGAILLLPTKADSRRNFSRDHPRNTTFLSNQPKDSISSFSNLYPSPLRSSNQSDLNSPSPAPASNKLRDSINTTTFGRNFKISPSIPESDHSRLKSIFFQNESASTFNENKLPESFIFNNNTSLQIHPENVFVKDEITGVHLQEKNNELVDEWLKDISKSNSSVSSIVKPKRKTRQGLHRRPTLFGKENRETSTSKISPEQNSNLILDNTLQVIPRKVSIKHRTRTWKANYLAKRHLISKLYIPPRNSSLPAADKNKPITPPLVSFKIPEIPRPRLVGIQFSNSKFQDKTSSSYGALYETLLQKAIPSKDLFAIQATNNNNFDKPNLLETSEGHQEVITTNHVRLPHFRSLLRKRRPLRVRRLSNRKVSLR